MVFNMISFYVTRYVLLGLAYMATFYTAIFVLTDGQNLGVNHHIERLVAWKNYCCSIYWSRTISFVMVSRYVLSQCFSGGADSPTYWTVKTVAGNMLGFNVERDGMPIPSSVTTIGTTISTAAPNAGQRIHFLFQFSFKSSLAWMKTLYFTAYISKQGSKQITNATFMKFRVCGADICVLWVHF